ncbi:penicillin acylase family protein [Pseudophaeobacter flagellatus]|uniref:penicillin acylase family protein n=1 Tax=Pseudophaeobacter flagellatus TaxID=2899119 RepID=UPI001E55D21E|nr:penicillin acylase family protein [Pseudophaeobacter flagellatus]MCD9146866.1 penicillin acylase family protein [Pseudophaeobacter flagellatus]
MARLFRWLFRLAAALILLALLASGLAYYLAAQSLPDYDKEIALPGLSAPVEIVRDNANVPHIFGSYGASDEDVYYGLGYAHAQDRLWQMAVMRRTAQGRLSEIFGTRTVETDIFLRRLDLYGLAQQSVSAQSPETRQALKAYSAGVNARLLEINEEALGRGAPEMFLFNMPMSPWQPADSIALMKLMALKSSNHLQEEVLRARTSLALTDPDRLRDILPDAPGKGTTALPEYAAIFPDVARYANLTAPDSAVSPDSQTPFGNSLFPVPPRGHSGASNAWAAAPNRSASGGTLLANDPHLTLSAPGSWYLARMELATGGIIGGTIPGIPAILSGRSEDLGWGITASYLDDQDLFIEKLNPETPEEYLSPQGYRKFTSRPSIIKIKDRAPVTLTLRWSENGPILPGSLFDLSTITPPGHVVSLAWTALDPQDTSMTAAIGLMRASRVAEAISVAEGFIAPSQNLVLADQQTIAQKTIGAFPARDARHHSKGRLPSQGWLRENRWLGRVPYAANPEFISPRGGILGNTNNKILERPFPNHVSYLWGDTQRINRWRRLMQNREVHTRDSFMEAQLDTVSYTARSLLPVIGADLWFTGETAEEGSRTRQRQIALSLLSEWNGEMNEHLPEPLLYAAWLRALQTRLIADDLGPLASAYSQVDPLFIERVYRDIEGAGIWCDVRQSAPRETCTDMARLALDDALIWIEARYGTALESLRWGDAHQATHDHETLGGVPILRFFVNIRQSTSGGDNTLQRGLTSGQDPTPFRNIHAAGYRGVYDFADPDSSLFILATGQSGHFLSRNYDDMAQLWRRGEYVPMSLDEDLARAAAVGVTVIQPRN